MHTQLDYILRPHQLVMAAIALCSACFGVAACEDGPSFADIVPVRAPPIAQSFEDMGAESDPPLLFCSPNQKTCLAENSPLFTQCDPLGQQLSEGSCDPGQICKN